MKTTLIDETYEPPNTSALRLWLNASTQNVPHISTVSPGHTGICRDSHQRILHYNGDHITICAWRDGDSNHTRSGYDTDYLIERSDLTRHWIGVTELLTGLTTTSSVMLVSGDRRYTETLTYQADTIIRRQLTWEPIA